MSAPTEPNSERVWPCSTHDKWFTKPRLIELANDLGIQGLSAGLLKPQILKIVDDHLNAASPVLSLEKKYQGLFAYKKSSTIDGMARGPHNGLTSAGKDAADAAAQVSTLQDDPRKTPSHNILQSLLRTSDPPGRRMTFQTSGVLRDAHAVDDSLVSDAAKLRQGLHSSDDDGSDASSIADNPGPGNQDSIDRAISQAPLASDDAQSPHGSPRSPVMFSQLNDLKDPAEAALWPSTPRRMDTKRHNIAVVFRDPHGKAAPEETWIQSGPEIPLQKTRSASGSREKYTARLSDLVPAVLAQHTPMKKGRIARPPVQRDGNIIDIGSIEALVDRRLKYLSMDKINHYDLEMNEDGDFVCEMFWQREENSSALPIAAVPSSEPHVGSEPAVSEVLSGSEHDSGLEKPKAAAIYHKSRTASSGDREDKQFLQHLRTIIGNPSASSKVKTAYDALKILRVVRDAEDTLDNRGWSLLAKKGGFVVPPTEKDWAGKSFTRETVYAACYVSRSSTTQYKKLFKTDRHPALKKLAEWVENPDDAELMKKFGTSSIRELAEWKEKKLHAGRKAGRSLKDVKGKSKRARSESESEHSMPSPNSSYKTKRAKQHRSAATSIDIDSDALDSE